MIVTNVLRKSAGWETIIRVSRMLKQRGIRVWVVGGWVRDSLLGRTTRDIDFAAAGNGLETAQRVAEELGGRYVMLDEVNGMGRVILKPGEEKEYETGIGILDFSTLNGDSIEEDLSRRDFTVDALAVEPGGEESSNMQIIDPHRGLADLEGKIIRATNEKVFRADPVRLLRAVRLAAQLDFVIEPETKTRIKREAVLAAGVAGERLHEELVRLLSTTGSGRYLAFLDELGLLTELFPELEITRNTEQPPEHYWEVLRHSLETVKAFDFVLHQNGWDYGNQEILAAVSWQAEYRDYFQVEVSSGSRRVGLFRLAALLHDIAKPQTKTIETGGKMRFLGHAQEGAETVPVIMERLRFSTREIRLVEAAVRHHMRPTQMGWPELPSKRAVYRFYRDAGEAAAGVLFLSLADHLATRGPTLDRENWQVHTNITGYILAQKTAIPRPEHWLIDGYDIMNRFDLNPGQRVGELLEAAHEAQAAGKIASKEEALRLIRDILNGHIESGQSEE